MAIRTSEGVAAEKIRALGIIAGYLCTSGDSLFREVGSPFKNGKGEFDNRKFRLFLSGDVKINVDEYEEIKKHLKHLIRDGNLENKLIEDYGYLQTALIDSELDDFICESIIKRTPPFDRTILSNEIYLDREFLRALKMERQIKSSDQLEIYNTMGGLWHVIRRDNSSVVDVDAAKYSISLLNIKPSSHFMVHENIFKEVHGNLLQFSFREKFGSEEIYTYRGRVIESEGNLYLIGSSSVHSRRRIFVMMLPMPHLKESFVGKSPGHAVTAFGTITAFSGDRVTLSPVGCRFITGTNEDNIELRNIGKLTNELIRRRAEEYDEKIMSKSRGIRNEYSKKELIDWIRYSNQTADPTKFVDDFEKVIEIIKGNGHFSFPHF